ncbi:2717_t:CDS:2, partial [Racocetra fulgida]
NKELKKNSFELDNVIIENLEIDSEDTTVYLFGIKIEGNYKIGALRIKPCNVNLHFDKETKQNTQ